MSDYEYYFTLIDGDQYKRIFKDLESGKLLSGWLNFEALCWGPLWYANRRILFMPMLLLSMLFGYCVNGLMTDVGDILGLLGSVLIYLVVFVAPSNFLYFRSVKSFIDEGLADGSLSEKSFVERFTTELNKGRRKMKAMRR